MRAIPTMLFFFSMENDYEHCAVGRRHLNTTAGQSWPTNKDCGRFPGSLLVTPGEELAILGAVWMTN